MHLGARSHDSCSTVIHRPQAEPVILEELLIWGVRWNNVQASILNFSFSLALSLGCPNLICFFSASGKRVSIIIPSLGLTGDNNSCRSQLFCMVTPLSFYCRHNDRGKWLKHGYGSVYVLLGAPSSIYAAATGVPQCHAFFMGSTASDLPDEDRK